MLAFSPAATITSNIEAITAALPAQTPLIYAIWGMMPDASETARITLPYAPSASTPSPSTAPALLNTPMTGAPFLTASA